MGGAYKIYSGDVPSILISENERAWFHGAAIVNGQLCCDVAQFKIAYSSALNVLTDVKGNCSFVIERNNRIILNSDPIGASFLYRYSCGGIIAYSSDLEHLLSWLSSHCNIIPQKSAFYQSALLSANDGHFGLSSYSCVSVLPSGSFVTFSGTKCDEDNVGVESYLQKGKSLNYNDILEEARADILLNARALGKSNHAQKIVHLTGGMDSRLMVSALLAAGVMDNFAVFCSGQRGVPDFDTAQKLCAIFGMKFGADSGTYAKTMPSTIEEDYDWKAQETLGMFHYPPVHKGYATRRDPLIVSGGYGECYRGYYLDASESRIEELGMKIWGISSRIGAERGVSSSAVKADLQAMLQSFMNDKISNGWSHFDALQLLYLQEKNRYFVGQTTQSVLRYTSRIDGLYSLPAFRAAYSLNNNLRSSRKLMFDLMNSFHSGISHAPFGTSAWPDHLGVDVKVWPSNSLEPKTDEWRSPRPPESWESSIPKPENIVDLANRVGAPVWQVSNFESARQAVKNNIDKNGNLYSFLDRKILGRVLNLKEPRRQEMRLVYNLLFSSRWLQS